MGERRWGFEIIRLSESEMSVDVNIMYVFNSKKTPTISLKIRKFIVKWFGDYEALNRNAKYCSLWRVLLPVCVCWAEKSSEFEYFD